MAGCASNCCIIIIGLWAMIQGFLYAILAIFAILAKNCNVPMNYSPFTYLINLVYFHDEDCGVINWEFLFDQTLPIEPEMPPVTQVAYRTYVLAIIYLILSVLWAITSSMIIITGVAPCLGRCAYHILLKPWIFITGCIIIFDVVATGFFIYDLIQTIGFESFLEHIEITNIDIILPFVPDDYEWVLPIPSVIMLATSSRLIIFWILNIVCFVIMCIENNKFMSSAPKYSNQTMHHQQQHQSNNMMVTQQQQQQQQQHQMNRYDDPHQHLYQYDNLQYQHTESSPSSTMAQQKQQQQYDVANENSRYPVYSVVERRYMEPLKGGTSSPSESDGVGGGGTSNGRASSLTTKSRQSPDSFDTNSNSNITSADTSNFDYREDQIKRMEQRSMNAPEEVRNQLPWSYFQSRHDHTGPKRAFTQIRDDHEDLPPVPVPDYTLHFPKKERLSSH